LLLIMIKILSLMSFMLIGMGFIVLLLWWF
jgi:hypothetical protein